MLSLLCASVVSVAVGIVVALVLVGGFGGYTAYKIYAKKTRQELLRLQLFGLCVLQALQIVERYKTIKYNSLHIYFIPYMYFVICEYV